MAARSQARADAISVLAQRESKLLLVLQQSFSGRMPVKEDSSNGLVSEAIKRKRRALMEQIQGMLIGVEFRPSVTNLIRVFLNEDDPHVNIESAISRDTLAHKLFPYLNIPHAKTALTSLLGSASNDLGDKGIKIEVDRKTRTQLYYYITVSEDEKGVDGTDQNPEVQVSASPLDQEWKDSALRSRRSSIRLGHTPGWNRSNLSTSKRKEKLGKTAGKPDHLHRWRIEEPNGKTSEGVCSCGEHKEFKNSSEEWGA